MSEEITEGGHSADAPVLDEPTGLPSIRDRIRAEREAIAAEKTLDLLVPGYKGQLAIRYRSVSDRELDAFIKQIQKDGEAGIRANYDLLIECCETVLVRVQEDGDLEPLTDDQDGPIRFDIRLAEFLGFEAASARETVVGVFSPDGSQALAPFEHTVAVISWLQGKSEEVDPALLGN